MDVDENSDTAITAYDDEADSEDNDNYGGDGNGDDGDGDGDDGDDMEGDQHSVTELELSRELEPDSDFEQEQPQAQTPNQNEGNDHSQGGWGIDTNSQGGFGNDSNSQGDLGYDDNPQGGWGYNDNPQGGCRKRNCKNKKGKKISKGINTSSHNSQDNCSKNNYQNNKQSNSANNSNFINKRHYNYEDFMKSGNNNSDFNNQNNYTSNNKNNYSSNNKNNYNNLVAGTLDLIAMALIDKNDDGASTPKKVDFFNQLKGIFKSSFKSHEAGPSPIDSLVLRLHYRMGVCLFLIAYNVVQSNWFLGDSIHCVSHFNAEEKVKFYIRNICLSYPYVCEEEEIAGVKKGVCPRQYILFYRWIYFSFLLLAGLYYIPRIIAKQAENPRLRKLMTDLAQGENRYDGSTWDKDTEIMLKYLQNHTSTHNTLYIWHVVCHVIALAIDVGVIFFFDFCLNGRFLKLIYAAYPFDRDPVYFKDELSRTFPPFVYCAIDTQMLINSEREDLLGCHLMLMELYEKMFIVIWFWLAVVTLCTALSVVCLLLVVLPPFNRLFLKMHTTSKDIRNIKRKILKLCPYGDLYVLYLMKCHRSEAQFIMFLKKFVHYSEDTLQEVVVQSENKKSLNWRERLTSIENITNSSNTVENERLLNDSQDLPHRQQTSNFHNKDDHFQNVSTSNPFPKPWYRPPTIQSNEIKE
nr:uncharacterized protein LOC123755090 [Procambarus clarkii]